MPHIITPFGVTETETETRVPPPQPKPRFGIAPLMDTSEAFWVVDNEHERWHLPERAVNMYMKRTSAIVIAEILNDEWVNFLRHPW